MLRIERAMMMDLRDEEAREPALAVERRADRGRVRRGVVDGARRRAERLLAAGVLVQNPEQVRRADPAVVVGREARDDRA